MLPPAPERFSTTTCWPSSSDKAGAMMRAVVSVPPPGSKPTTVVTGFCGYCACAAAAKPKASTARAAFIANLLIGNNAGALHDRLPFRDFVFDERIRVFRCVLHDRRASRFERLADLRLVGGALQGLVEPADHVARRRGGYREPEPGGNFVAFQPDLVERRHVRQRAGALEAGHGERAHLPGADVRQLRRQIVEHEVDLPREHRCLRGA